MDVSGKKERSSGFPDKANVIVQIFLRLLDTSRGYINSMCYHM
jgi:hypothetical protein